MIDKSVTFRCPESLLKELDQTAKTEGINRTAVMLSRLQVDLPNLNILDRSELPKTAGIYFVWKRGEKKILYIGQSKNLQARFKTHNKLGDFLLDHENTFISWFKANYDELETLEGDYINDFETELNIRGKGVKGGRVHTANISKYQLELIEAEAFLNDRTAGQQAAFILAEYANQKETDILRKISDMSKREGLAEDEIWQQIKSRIEKPS